MPNDKPINISPTPLPPSVPIAAEVWVARRFGLPDATAIVIAELAFGAARSRIEGAH